jgi:3,4-dihydroxy 2-butanone 4-phosphate synthase/GTP cyclohydrolase II
MRMIAAEGRGIIVLIREYAPGMLSDRLRARMEDRAESGAQLRDYGVGAQILLDLGVKEMILVSNTRRTIIGLEGYGLSVVGQRPISEPSVEP